jgi:GT2 family glycosyltransferase
VAEERDTVTAVVVNYNAGPALQSCVQALLDSGVPVRVVVTDNASSDDSMNLLEETFGGHDALQVQINAGNLGFARAVNACARQAGTAWVLVINPDCELASGSLAVLLGALRAEPRAALAAPRVLDSRGRVEQASLRRFPRPWNSLVTFTGLWRLGKWLPAFAGVSSTAAASAGGTVRAEAVSGACMLIRARALQEVGYFDEAYGLHCEDLDLMYRLQQAGWHCLYVPEASAVHKQGLSSRSRPLWVHLKKHQGMSRFYGKFLSEQYVRPFSWLVLLGIWLHFLLLLPVAWLKR